ncbi:MAG TPA: hypothetical protein VH040_17730 [Usitatibacter sp.]|nr:hypothetical protein [Usitatibacter sp.]
MKWSLAVVFSMLASSPVFADCQWEWLCKGDGSACKQMPVCDTLYDKPGPRPETPQPAPPIAMRPDKLAGDLGTATCEHVMRQAKNGEWEWSRACYCSDASKNTDPSNPLANITRCEASWEK